MCYPTSGERVVLPHFCGGKVVMEFEAGEPQTWEHPGTSDQWYPVEPYCCPDVENDDTLEVSADAEANMARDAACPCSALADELDQAAVLASLL